MKGELPVLAHRTSTKRIERSDKWRLFGTLIFTLFIGLTDVSAAVAQLPQRAGSVREVAFIGTATMSADGTITLRLVRTADNQPADGMFTYKIGDPGYEEILRHIGGLKPGETKSVPPWP